MPDRHQRRKDHIHEYRDQKNNNSKSIVVDKVGYSVSGFYVLPVIWVADKTDPHPSYSPTTLSEEHKNKVLDLECGLKFKCSFDGRLIYDFFDFPSATQVFIPGYTVIDDGVPRVPPKAHTDAENEILTNIKKRVTIMNVHQLLLWSAAQQLGGHMDWPVPLNYEDVMHGNSIDGSLHHTTAFSRGRYHAQKFLEADARQSPSQTPRRSVGWDCLKISIDNLDHILSVRDEGLVLILEEIYFATCQHYEGRMGISLIGFWAVIEQMLDKMWQEDVAKKELPGGRRKKLNYRDYTASVRIEILRIIGYLSDDLYGSLEVARKARNDWIHNMRKPSESDLQHAKSVLNYFIIKTLGFELRLPAGFGSGYGYSSISGDPRALERFNEKD